MKLTVQKSELTRGLQLVDAVVQKKTTMPILLNLLLSTEERGLKIAGTDLDVAASTIVSGKIAHQGSTTVNARIFSDIVRELPDGEIKIEKGEGERIEVVTKGSRFKILGVSADEYPSLPGMSLTPKSSIDGTQLIDMVQKTSYAVSTDETRFNLSGICCEVVQPKKGQKQLRMVATDGHRLALVNRPVDDISFEGRAIVPRKGLSEVKRLLADGAKDEMQIDIRDGFFVVEANNSRITTRLIDGDFPDYHGVIPQKAGSIALIPGADFTQAIRRVALMVSDKAKCVKFDIAPGGLRISSSSPELGEAVEELDVTYKGAPLSIGFNARYVLEAVTALAPEGNVAFEFGGELDPGKMFLENDESAIAIVMPMRLS